MVMTDCGAPSINFIGGDGGAYAAAAKKDTAFQDSRCHRTQ
jgi:hypothetical protein